MVAPPWSINTRATLKSINTSTKLSWALQILVTGIMVTSIMIVLY